MVKSMLTLQAAVVGALVLAYDASTIAQASPVDRRSEPCSSKVHRLSPPAGGAAGASIAHTSSFASFSFEPAFWVEFFGTYAAPNSLTFSLLDRIYERGGRPIIRPGGITMDSMIFDTNATDPVRDTSPTGGVYRTTVGPEYYKSWSHFPEELRFVSTLNFGNDSVEIARGMAEASVKYQPQRVEYLELGNEPTNYPSARWGDSTEAYVAQWKNWTQSIDAAVNTTLSTARVAGEVGLAGKRRWWASSATTDKSGLNVRPVDVIPAGIDAEGSVAQYSIHSYPFATCDPARAAVATLPNLLNHTRLSAYADDEIMPSAQAALDSGSEWIIGEFNSVACSGQPNVTDTFAQALWVVDSELIYAVRNASSVHLHQGATLVFQSSQQTNSAADDGKPGFSTYDFVYPVNSTKRGEARALPSFVAQLFLAETFAEPVRAAEIPPPKGVNPDSFAAYAFYHPASGKLSKLALLNLEPMYNATAEISLDLSGLIPRGARPAVKRMTAPAVNEADSDKVTWAGQSYTTGQPHGHLHIESLHSPAHFKLRNSQAALILIDPASAYSS
ncbi:uncharacterized protein PAN0_006d3066 [Moesziomyces antarcticus]|uniref:Uncharacterized protein n=2 Tax=Pseudozyma antarctica TaxID=84753 RepID=A0A5C3FNN7_PSEA2|nr:uncharacterized protein PAN0_006d3066 [Moesziomyces antarcticus]GAK64851.1 conserved hypothetical protein [Moesziomyces antarcticus]SPO45846.1 uncharacterized protein PSANT_03532 [Moesziomyces antarcticus]